MRVRFFARFASYSIPFALSVAFGCGGDDTIDPGPDADSGVEDGPTTDGPTTDPDGGTDVFIDAPKQTCKPEAPFVEAAEVPGLHLSGASEIAARYTPDGLTAIVTRITENDPNPKLHIATRPSATTSFTPGAPLPGPVNELPAGIASRGFLADNALTLFFEAPKAAGSSDYDILVATRASTSAQFGTPATAGSGTNIATAEFEGQPFFVADQLWFGRRTNNAFAIHRAIRTSNNQFTTPVEAVANLGTSGAPVLAADLLTIYVVREGDIYVARRQNAGADFGELKKLDAPVNTAEGDEEPTDVSSDGCLLYFTRGPSAGLGERRAFAARRGQ
jgi:hypothetical protein